MIQIDIPNLDDIKQKMQEMTQSQRTLRVEDGALSNEIQLFRHFKFLPQSSGVYFLFNEKRELIYIGATKNLYKRFYQHRSQTVWFNSEAAYVSYILKKDLNIDIYEAETIYIAIYASLYNNKPDNFIYNSGGCGTK